MRVDSGMPSGGGAGDASKQSRFDAAMKAEAGASGAGDSSSMSSLSAAMPQMADMLDSIVDQMKELVQQLAQLIEAMSSKAGGKYNGASSIGPDGRTRSVETGVGASGLGGTQGPSERIPDPSANVREVKLGGKTMTIGSDGSASKAEVDRAAGELQRMYDSSPTFRKTVDSADGDLTVTLGRRGDNTSWGGGGRVFLNLNNISAGANDRFQGIVGHEFAHAAGLPHGAELDSIEDRVRKEA